MALTSPFYDAATTLLNTVTSQAWEPLVSLCRNGTLSQLQSIQIGRLTLYESKSSKASTVFGTEQDGAPSAVLNVHDEKFWVRLALFADMGFAESYMLGEASSPDLTEFFEVGNSLIE